MIIKSCDQREAQSEAFSAIPVSFRDNPEALDGSDDVFAENALSGDVTILGFILLGQRIFLAGFFRHFGVGVDFLQAEITEINNRFYFWVYPRF